MPERTHDLGKVKEEFFAQGYSLVEDAVEPEMVDRLEAAARRVWAKVRAGEVDVAGNGPEATAIFGVIAPEFGEPVFAEHLVSPAIERYVKTFWGRTCAWGTCICGAPTRATTRAGTATLGRAIRTTMRSGKWPLSLSR